MESARPGIESALLDFLAALRAGPRDLGASWNSLEKHPAWSAVRAHVADHVPESARPDLYRDNRLDDRVLLQISGLGQTIQRAVISDDSVQDHDLAADFATFCTREAPMSEEWILLDADLPTSTRVTLGDHSLETLTHADLLNVSPLPNSAAQDDEAGPMPPGPLQGAAFLRSVKPDRPLLQGIRFRWPFDSRIELDNWLPLFALLLWSPNITRAEATFEVEPGRHIALVDGEPAIWEDAYTAPGGQVDEYLRHHKQGITVTADEIPAFEAFAASVIERTQRVLESVLKAGWCDLV